MLRKKGLYVLGCIFTLIQPSYVNSQVATNENPTQTQEEEIKEEVILDLKQGETEDEDVLFVKGEYDDEEIQTEFRYTFPLAIQVKNYDRIEKYIVGGANINHDIYDGNTIVNISSFHRDPKFLSYAASKKANLSNLNIKDESIIYWGAAGRRLDYMQTIKHLMEPKAFDALMSQRTKTASTPLHAAVLYSGDKAIIEWLVANRVDLNAKDENGQTALHYAAAIRKWDILLMLLEKGANIKETDNNGKSVEEYLMESADIFTLRDAHEFLTPANQIIIDSKLASLNLMLYEGKDSASTPSN